MTTKGELTASTVIEGIIKLSSLPIIGFKGYNQGYLFAKGAKSNCLHTKAMISEQFFSSKAEK